jgi:signal transduction histidine kinase
MVENGMLESPEVLEVLKRIGEEALRAGDIIHRLRGMIRRQESEFVEEDVARLLEEITPLASVDARLNEVELEISIPRYPLKILADGVQIQQVVLNLIRNGIDAMADTPRDQRRLLVRVESSDGDTVEVSVSDRGCGLPDQSDKTLFEPFFTTKEGGLGLGLSISRTIVSAHGGVLSFTRKPEGGTTFWFSLPTAKGIEDE